jgi:hypothetical protein
MSGPVPGVLGGGGPQKRRDWKSDAFITDLTQIDFPSIGDLHNLNLFQAAKMPRATSLNDIARALPAFALPETDITPSGLTVLYTPWFDVNLDGLGFASRGVELNVAFALSALSDQLTRNAAHAFGYYWAFFRRFHLNGDTWGSVNSDTSLRTLPGALGRCTNARKVVFGSLMRASGE